MVTFSKETNQGDTKLEFFFLVFPIFCYILVAYGKLNCNNAKGKRNNCGNRLWAFIVQEKFKVFHLDCKLNSYKMLMRQPWIVVVGYISDEINMMF
jgi:hypothetical protein